jgi:hypothetical protein
MGAQPPDDPDLGKWGIWSWSSFPTVAPESTTKSTARAEDLIEAYVDAENERGGGRRIRMFVGGVRQGTLWTSAGGSAGSRGGHLWLSRRNWGDDSARRMNWYGGNLMYYAIC